MPYQIEPKSIQAPCSNNIFLKRAVLNEFVHANITHSALIVMNASLHPSSCPECLSV